MIVIAILAIPFCFYFSKTDFSASRSDVFGKIYDRKVSTIEFQRNARLFNLARELGMYTFLQDLAPGATTETAAYSEFTWNRLVLRHEAERLGIRPSGSEIVEAVKKFQPFRTEKGFDITKYNEIAQTVLPAKGFTEEQIEELASDQLTLARVKELLGAGVQLPESESREYYDHDYAKLEVAVVRLRMDDFAKDVKISDEDIAKYFEAHKAQLKTEEKRKVEFVSFALTDEQKKLTGKPRVDVLQKLADHANDFNQALIEKGAEFHQVAEKFQVPVKATGDFTVAAPDPQLNADAQLAQSAFKLTAQEPNSDALQVADGFFVLHLAGVTEARPLTLDEAKTKVVDALKNQRLHELVSNKGSEVAQKLREAVKSGAPIDKAAEQLGLKAEHIPPFALSDKPTPPSPDPKEPKVETPDLPMVKNAVAELSAGGVTEFVPTQTGGIVAVLEKREPFDAAKYEQTRGQFEGRYLEGKREIVFYEWLRDRRHEAGAEMSPG